MLSILLFTLRRAPNGFANKLNEIASPSSYFLCRTKRFQFCSFSKAIETDGQPSQGSPQTDYVNPIDYELDKYNGVIITPSGLPENPLEFNVRLQQSLKLWENLRFRGIWLKVPVQKVALLPVAISLDFKVHHAVEDYFMLTKWLPQTSSTLPPYASHQVGVGAIIERKKSSQPQILAVKEKNGLLKDKEVWKIPTGLVHVGEDLKEAVCRETFEETGVQSEFKSIIAFRQSHQVSFGISDLYFLCHLNALSDEIELDSKEIRACEWIPIEDFVNQDFYKSSPAYSHQVSIISGVITGKYPTNNDSMNVGLKASDSPLGFRPGTTTLYHL